MATVSKEIALSQVEHQKGLKRPSLYCIVKYRNTFTGGTDYKLCKRRIHYLAMLDSPAVSETELLWMSAGCRADEKDGQKKKDPGYEISKDLGFF